MQDDPKASVIDRLKQANNVLVTVSKNPTVDQLAGAIGLTLLLNKIGKHANAVFSGDIPSTIEFLQPEKTLETNTDSLRDFIISLDKDKADKLRYKVEDKFVRIFITPYKTSINQNDLQFSQGDFNVDVVMALGVHEQSDIDQAISAHGRILHDATIISVNSKTAGNLGNINWIDNHASSLCEMLGGLGTELKKDVFDGQISTALLTGIVAETKRFSNEKTTAVTMSVSAKLMSSGANQQLVASKLQETPKPPKPPEAVAESTPPPKKEPEESHDRSELQIKHEDVDNKSAPPEKTEPSPGQVHIDEHGTLRQLNGTDSSDAYFDTGQTPTPPADNGSKASPQKDENPPSSTPPPATDNTSSTPPPATDNTYSQQSSTVGNVRSGQDTGNSRKETGRMLFEPPAMSGAMSNDSYGAGMEDNDSPRTPSANKMLLSHDSSKAKRPAAPSTNQPAPARSNNQSPPPENPFKPEAATDQQQPEAKIDNDQTLSQIEKAVDSPHTDKAAPLPDIDAARNAVSQAASTGGNQEKLEPIVGLGAQPVNLDLGHNSGQQQAATPPTNSGQGSNNTTNAPTPPPPASNNSNTPPPPPTPPPFMPT